MDLDRLTWSAAIRLAAVLSVVAALFAVAARALGDVPQAAIVLPVITGAFVASWVQTSRLRSQPAPVHHIGQPHRRAA